MFSARGFVTKISCRYVETASIFRHNRWLRFAFQPDCEARGINFHRQPYNSAQGVDELDAAGRHRSAGVENRQHAQTALVPQCRVSKLWCRNVAIATA